MDSPARIQLLGDVEGYLDVAPNTPFVIKKSIADIRDISSRSGTRSYSISLPGTENNIKLLGYYSEVNIVSGTFNVALKTPCLIVRDGMVLEDELYFQLVSVTYPGDRDGDVEFVGMVKDAAADFFTEIAGRELSDIDLSDFDHELNSTNVVTTFNNDVDDGYKYHFPYSPNAYTHLTECKPAVYAKYYFDRIFSASGFQYEWSRLSDSDVLFDKYLIPYNGDKPKLSEDFIEHNTVEAASSGVAVEPVMPVGVNQTFVEETNVFDVEISDPAGLYTPATGHLTPAIIPSVTGLLDAYIDINWTFSLNNDTVGDAYLRGTSGVANWGFRYEVMLRFIRVSDDVVVGTSNILLYANYASVNNATRPVLPTGVSQLASGNKVDRIGLTNITTATDIEVAVEVKVTPLFQPRWRTADNDSAALAQVNMAFEVTSGTIRYVPTETAFGFGSTVRMNEFIPKKILQSDFVKSIFMMNNLLVTLDPDNANKMILQHRDDFYDTGDVLDWSKKIDFASDIERVFLSELTGKKMLLTYKEGVDDVNKGYVDATKERYGQLEYTFESEHVKGVDVKEVIFEPSPIIKKVTGAVVPMWNGIEPKIGLRVLLDGGQKTCDSYDIYNYYLSGAWNKATTTNYPAVTHFDNPDNPSYDINFGTNDYYFYDVVSLTNNNLYNTHWRRTISQLERGEMLKCRVALSFEEVRKLQLNEKIYCLEKYWHINTLMYDANGEELAQVELISADEDVFLGAFPVRRRVSVGNTGVLDDKPGFIDDFYGSANHNYTDIPIDFEGEGNYVHDANGVDIIGSNNVVENSDDIGVTGNDNTIEGVDEVEVFGSNKEPGESNTLVAESIEATEVHAPNIVDDVVRAELTTSDETLTELTRVLVEEGEVIVLDGTITNSGSGEYFSEKFTGTWAGDSGATLVGSVRTSTQSTIDGVSVTYSTSGNYVVISVTGIASTTYNWKINTRVIR